MSIVPLSFLNPHCLVEVKPYQVAHSGGSIGFLQVSFQQYASVVIADFRLYSVTMSVSMPLVGNQLYRSSQELHPCQKTDVESLYLFQRWF